MVGVSLEPEADPSTTDRALMSATRESQMQLQNLIQRLDAAAETSLVAHITQENSAVGLLLDELYAQSRVHKVQLMDPDLESGIKTLDQRVSVVGAAMSGLDMNPSKEDDQRRAAFEARWT
jgi:hypothetical protein